MVAEEDGTENLWLDEHAGPVVRPYAMTQGRTRPMTGEFDLIALVVATQPVSSGLMGLGPEHTAIISLCQHPMSVAQLHSQRALKAVINRLRSL